ncbi:tripartite tricarboxylate transporter permease [Arthrobacter sp. APC 3897]|uniref:tripartite tricarboxylate transporter permease n=1 Tax=Arthrobacter sp. APC 3897 TaxID=3035204 RepID=UPI0025B4F564|nr:tripartite tricarboxylate transporter permease [Arthrobacter sp. APC 3897]MDN3481380.1 tripartite tricarboxylate transporter permease [Arthrobacter sp. APC 3897]
MPDAGFSTSLEEMDAGISINNTVSGFPEIQDATPLFDCSVVPAGQPQLRSLTAHQQARLRSGDGSARPRVLNASAWPGASGRYALLVFMPDAVCGGGRRRHRRRYRCGDHLAQVFAELLGGAMASDGFHIVAPEPSGQYAAHAITGHCAAPACIQRRGSDLRPRHAHQGALATAAIGSFVAGTIATALVAFFAPWIVDVAVKLGPQDYLALMVVAFMTVSALVGSSPLRGVVAMVLGLVIGIVGIDFQSGQSRLTFGMVRLLDGVDVVVLIVALFAIGEVLYVAAHQASSHFDLISIRSQKWMTRQDWKRSWKPWLRGTAIGFPLGVIPAGGSEIPTFLSYSLEKKLSKHPEEFGKGAIEGVAGPEAANNSNVAGAMVPLLTLGIPTSATAAVILVAFQQYGIQPGPQLLETQPALVWGLIASLFIGNFMLLVLNLPLVGVWVKILHIPKPYLYAGIATFALLGAYSVNGSTFDVGLMLFFGIIGYLLRRYGFPIAPLIVGAILGPLAELQMRRALDISAGDLSALVSTPFTVVVYAVLALVILVPMFLRASRRRAAGRPGTKVAA